MVDYYIYEPVIIIIIDEYIYTVYLYEGITIHTYVWTDGEVLEEMETSVIDHWYNWNNPPKTWLEMTQRDKIPV